MKKLVSFFMAVVIFVLGIAVYAKNLDGRIEEKLLSNKNAYQNVKFGVLSESDDLNKVLFSEDTLLVMGSSEFNPSSSIEMNSFPLTLYKRENYDFNLVLLGQGHTQSLWHAIELGAIADNIQNKKVVLIVSPQWFTEGGIAPEGFASLFSSKTYYEALKNEKISKAGKDVPQCPAGLCYTTTVEDRGQSARVLFYFRQGGGGRVSAQSVPALREAHTTWAIIL